MFRNIRFAVCLGCLVGLIATQSAALVQAQIIRNGVVSTYEARRNGLERVWASQVQVDRSRGRVVAIVPHVSIESTTTLFEIRHENRITTISEKHLDAFRRTIGVEGARAKAEGAIAEMKKLGLKPEPTLVTRVVPEITLYATTDQGTVQAIDGESGKTRWIANIGNYSFPTTAAAANDQYVSVINGSNVFLLSAKTGSVVWERRTMSVPMAGPALSDEHVFIPTASGMIESYSLVDQKEPIWKYKGDGRMLLQPVVANGTLAWPTELGHIYVASVNPRAMRYRMDTSNYISAAPSILGTKLYATTANGYVYCLNLLAENVDTRRVLWKFPMGEGSNQSPVGIRDSIYAITNGGMLFCLNAEDGTERWRTTGVYRFLSASENRIYAIGDIGRIVVIDSKSGGRISEIFTDEIDLHIANPVTDRIFIGTRTGVFICLRETGNQYPVVHAMISEAPKPKRAIIKKGLGEDGNAKPKAGADDPFAAPAAPAPADDPFGGGAMEKKPAPAKPADDPFGS